MDFGFILHKIMKQFCRVLKHRWQRLQVGRLLDMRTGKISLVCIDRCTRCHGTWIEPVDGPQPPDRV